MTSSRIVFATWGSLGDLHPYLALAVELKRRGHRTVLATLPTWREAVETTGVGFHPVGPDVPANSADGEELVRRVLDPKEGPKYLFKEVLGPATRDSYEALLDAVRADGGADLLVTHQLPLVGPVVAEVTGIPWVSALLQPFAFLSAFDPPAPPQAPKARALFAVHPAVAKALYVLTRGVTIPWTRPLRELRAALGLPRGRNPILEGQHSPRLVLALFSQRFAKRQPDFPAQALITGFAFYDAVDERPPSQELLRFLDEGAPPILFTLGSAAVWIAGDFYETSIAAASALGRRALLLAGEDAERLRAAGLPAGIAAFEYAPHSVVMPRAAAIVHQGGVGTTGQALRAGRPSLVVPFGQDQPDNARRCVELGVAQTLARGQYVTSRVTHVLSQLLETPSYATRAADFAAHLRAERGTATACDAIERVLTS